MEEQNPEPKKGLSEAEFQETLDYINQHPLFMKEIPEDISENKILMSLQNILFDDDPENIANYCNVNLIINPGQRK